MASNSADHIRKMMIKDLKSIIAIDSKIQGKSRPDYWEAKLITADKTSPVAPLVAELDGEVVGFILGDASGWEYGAPDNIGWIDAMCIDPDHQGKGFGKSLMGEMVYNLKKVGVSKIYTMVDWRECEVLKFLARRGFRSGNMINLELEV